MERISDFIGSLRGLVVLAVVEIIYMTAGVWYGFDRYPFPFLTLVLSLIALQFSQVIIVVQNRQGQLIEEKADLERREVSADLAADMESLSILRELRDRL